MAGGGVGTGVGWGVLVAIPENFRRMDEAYQLALAQLGLTGRSVPLTEIVAKLSEENPKAICDEALRRLHGFAGENASSRKRNIG